MESLRMVFLRIIWKDINTHNITKLTTQLAIYFNFKKLKYTNTNQTFSRTSKFYVYNSILKNGFILV